VRLAVAGQVDPDQARDQARQILGSRRYKPADVPRPFEGVLDWLGDRLRPIGDFFSRLTESLAGKIVLAAVLAGIVTHDEERRRVDAQARRQLATRTRRVVFTRLHHLVDAAPQATRSQLLGGLRAFAAFEGQCSAFEDLPQRPPIHISVVQIDEHVSLMPRSRFVLKSTHRYHSRHQSKTTACRQFESHSPRQKIAGA